ncbi:MAG: HAD family hydrolase [Firmicutes bacterium]|nr:HAD family hydrolase [Bacillota bacterium]
MTRKYKAAIFDFDGLIIDTESPWFEIYQEIYARFGQSLTADQWSAYVGTHDPNHDWYTALAPHIGQGISRAALRAEADALHKARMEKADLRPGVLDYLEAAQELGLSIGLASSSTASWVLPFLDRHGLRERFQTICTADDVLRVKPDPALYMLACQRLGVAPSDAIAFEDSPNGAKAAKTAGLACVVVPNGLTADYAFDAHDWRLASMADMAFATLLQNLQR